ncbi:MAG: sigma-54-dependent Fis family transcriptional regulator [Rhodoferax sp.]|nr:sigma-54-dependent Fis family transcriptional regulator [Rhodoferax sp.]OIP25539.1 MAG: sigma-54-dependent Fis family transcriptional regulator [Comamonadaceae bacterium CG2_30_60_41]PIW08384.1 MAG: sigma-54-dependent Fis family transcriptional regulator [Comamonadaceae bacterium CG17_big_fil_post_rev_8_21_14_2_50_60_13]PIY27306.1 MAG: sigma-54-dependent Fis family transcriptional regulator [Comamonadaceae bacterium CG_4_10_14_3_um_filter_60_75]PJC15800.1 MAG: sigma-54-dependent Fis family t
MTATASSIRILVVDDEPDLRTLYELTLLREGYSVDTAENLQQAHARLAQGRYDVLITDMRLPDGLGMSLINDVKSCARNERCIVITAYGSTQNAVEALKAGAFDYLTKPVDLKQFRAVVASAVRSTATVAAENINAASHATQSVSGGALGQRALSRLVGHSECMQQVKERILKIAPSMAPVMVTGESGTGKELVAYAIHANSHRAKGPWVAVNCSAIPETLLEAEFFGAKKGAYTGATQDREGFFHAARGGTLFLDEIGDLPLPMQSKLLRAIQERRIRPLGSNQEDAVDVRIVSATHKNLAQEVQNGTFRQDLFYRLNVIDMVIAPLRERTEDMPDLCQALLARIAEEANMTTPTLTEEALDGLTRMPLPGNVRELENLLYRAVALSDGLRLSLDAPSQEASPVTPNIVSGPTPAATVAAQDTEPGEVPLPDDLQAYLDGLERNILTKALQTTRFNRTAAATRLGLSLRQMRYRIERLQIEAPATGFGQDDFN